MGILRDLTPEEIRMNELKTAEELYRWPKIPEFKSRYGDEQIFSADRRVDDPRCAIAISLGIAALLGSVLGWVARVAWVKWFIN